MLITISNVLNQNEVKQFREYLDVANWENGTNSAGSIAINVKNNQQLKDNSELCISLGNHILSNISQNPIFISAALPDKIYPPKFNSYKNNETYGAHIDGSLMQIPNTTDIMRTDLSATIFLSNPSEYEGGELVIHTQYGTKAIKLNAGDMVLYPSTSLHEVTPVTKGVRVASFFWIQSMVKDILQRQTLYNLDQCVQKLSQELGTTNKEVVNLSGIYHNLIRQWASTN